MATLTIRDPYGNEFEIDATASPFWEHREGFTILPADQASEDMPDQPDTKPTSKKAASRPASEDKE